MTAPSFTRRQALLVAGGGFVAACTSEQREAYAQGADRCVAMPGSTEGPFFSDRRAQRSDIRERRPGEPLLVRLKVVEAGSCAPVQRAFVDVWHCDAVGVYSSFDRQPGGIDASRQSFLRGLQYTNAAGAVEFTTIWPGWYPGRAPHIHLKVGLGDTDVLTAQLFFPDQLNAKVYGGNSSYNRRWSDAARNERDGIFNDARGAGLATVSEAGGTLVAALDLAIERRA